MSSSHPPRPPILTTPLSLTRTLTDFLTIALHTLLSARSLYPHTAFLTTRAYSLPVTQCRHPAVISWITSTITHLTPLLSSSSIQSIIFVIFSSQNEVLERYIFDISRFPVTGEKEKWTEFEGQRGVGGGVEEQLRAAVKGLQGKCAGLGGLPGGCSFSVVVEVREGREGPVGRGVEWVVAEPGMQIPSGEEENEGSIGKDRGGVRSTPVRLVEAGEFVMEMWIEEGAGKFGGGDGDG